MAVTSRKGPTSTARVGEWVSAGTLALVGLVVWLPAVLAPNASQSVVQGATQEMSSTPSPRGRDRPAVRAAHEGRPVDPTVKGVFQGAEPGDRCCGLVNAAADLEIQLDLSDRDLAFAQRGVEIDPLSPSVDPPR